MTDPSLWIAACAVAFTAGAIKGTVGFAMPMVMLSGLAIFFPADVALAGLIGATVVTNIAQALRQGVAVAWGSVVKFRRFLIIVIIGILCAAQLVPLMPVRLFYGLIGTFVISVALINLMGWELAPKQAGRGVELIMSVIAGIVGGLSGIWGPPTLAYLLSLNLSKQEMVRVQGVVYGLGALALSAGHMASGILNRETLPFSLALIIPALIGLQIGFWLQDRLDRDRFITLTLIVLLCSGANLLRRAVF